MGIYHTFYAEIKVNGKWFFLGPSVRTVEGRFVAGSLFWGKSYLGEFYEEMEDLSVSRGFPKDLSDVLKEKFSKVIEEEEKNASSVWCWERVCVVPFSRCQERIKRDRPYLHQGYVLKTLVDSFEVGETEEISWWLSKGEYQRLPKEEKFQYTWYSWNNTFDVYCHFQRLVSMVEHLYAWFDDIAIPYGNGEYDGSTCSLSDIRIIGIAG